MKRFISILIALMVLTGYVGFNQLYTDCPVCSSQEESCCNPETETGKDSGADSCDIGDACCIIELVKLESPFLLYQTVKKIPLPQKDLVPGFDVLIKYPASLQVAVNGGWPPWPPGVPNPSPALYCIFKC